MWRYFHIWTFIYRPGREGGTGGRNRKCLIFTYSPAATLEQNIYINPDICIYDQIETWIETLCLWILDMLLSQKQWKRFDPLLFFFISVFAPKFSKNISPTNEGAYFNQNDKIIAIYRAAFMWFTSRSSFPRIQDP